MRLLANGAPDQDFGADGRITLDFEGTHTYDVATAVAIDRKQRIVIAGSADRYFTARLGIVRLLQDGSFDSAFGNDGVSVVGDDEGLLHDDALKLAADGKILVAGERTVNPQTDMMVARLLDDGSPDASFGAQGIATVALAPEGTAWQSRAHGLDEQSDGKIVLAGWARDPGNNNFLAAARIESDGGADPNFGSAGFSTFDLAESPDAYHVLNSITLSAGRILAAGATDDTADLLIRLQSDLIFTDSF